MIDWSSVFSFSREQCTLICAFLIPANLIATLQTLIFAWTGRSRSQWMSATVASLCAGLLILHVMTWLAIGVIMLPTYILFSLGSLCLAINAWVLLGGFQPVKNKIALQLGVAGQGTVKR